MELSYRFKLLMLALVLSSITVYGVLSAYQDVWVIPSSGTITYVGIEVYQDPDLTLLANSLDWGVMTPNTTRVRLLYVYNNGSTPCWLNITLVNWGPVNVTDYVSITSDYVNEAINPLEFIPVEFTCSISPDAQVIEVWSVDLRIEAYEV